MSDNFVMQGKIKMTTRFLAEAQAIAAKEYNTANRKFPWWPSNVYEGLAILAEEVGELNQAVLDCQHKGGSIDAAIIEAGQVAAMAMRNLQFLLLKQYERAGK